MADNYCDEIAEYMRANAADFVGAFTIHSAGIPHVTRTEDGSTPTFSIRCGNGWLISFPSCDPGHYSEFCTEFITDDGKALQLATVGRDENKEYALECERYQPLHAYLHATLPDDFGLIKYYCLDEDTLYYIDKED